VSVIALNRRFVEWNNKEPVDLELSQAISSGEGGLGWDTLLAKRRVVILAEAGSGKSTEMAEAGRLAISDGRFAFYASLEDIGCDGLEGSLRPAAQVSLATWRNSNDDAWFFMDSVDQAKARGIRLIRALGRLSDGIHGAKERAHIVVSGRITDWEFRKDLDSLKSSLPIVAPETKPTPEEALLRIIRQEHRPERQPVEQPIVVIMAPLDPPRVRLFATAKGVPNVDEFLEQIEAANLWHFARRPLDLDWLVEFWQNEARLGSLTEMLELSVRERLKETNPDRSRSDTLDVSRAICAAERIGAAMVFGRKTTISIPDSQIEFSSDSPLDLADVLADWSTNERAFLLTRAVFDPATLGRARFHNDNEGIVRSYLAGRWLTRRRQENLSTVALFDLLFATSYGLEVVRPSLQETAAWLALWDKDVARELVRRSPMVLLDQGDPASLSLDVRRDALTRVVEQLAAGNHQLVFFDNDRLRRFAHPDLTGVVRTLWRDYHCHKEAARLLLRIVWLGALKGCAELAAAAAFEALEDSTTRVLAGRALLATSDDSTKERYARLIVNERSTVPGHAVRDAVVDLFPYFIGIDDLLSILQTDSTSDDQGALDFKREGPELIQRLNSPSDLEKMLRGMLSDVGDEILESVHQIPSSREEAYFPAIAVAAQRLLEASGPDVAPEIAVLAVLQIGNRWNRETELETAMVTARSELHRTSSRRRCAFWHVVDRLRRSLRLWGELETLWQVETSGYSAGLRVEDIDWLMKDGLDRGGVDCRLATNSALEILRAAGSPDELREKITKAAKADAGASEVYGAWTQRQPAISRLTEADRELQERRQERATETAENDKWWINIIRDLPADQARIARLKVPVPPNVISDLVSLWRLLDGASKRSRYAVESVDPLIPLVGKEVAEAVREGLIQHWRNSAPLLLSRRDPNARNAVRCIDSMGVAGVSLDAAASPKWAERLSAEEARMAAGYATLELNAFPSWVSNLAVARPQETASVFLQEIMFEILTPELNHYSTLRRVCHPDETIAALVAPALLDHLEACATMPLALLSLVLQVIERGIQLDVAPRFITLAVERFKRETDVAVAICYAAAVFNHDPAIATEALSEKMAMVSLEERADLLDRFLALTFGDTLFSSPRSRISELKTETLDQLVRMVFQIKPATPRSRPAGIAYFVDDQDRTDFGRNAVFNHLVSTPGAATFAALLRLQENPDCPLTASRLRELAENRAVQDSESAPWPPQELLAFEQSHDTAPRTSKDLQTLALRRLADMQYDLVDGDFNQRVTLRNLRNEVDVQNWTADRLRLRQGRSYSVEREPHVAKEKEPDVRLRAKASDGSVAIEIKVADSWTLKDLENALEDQLCGRYLRSSEGRHGILLLVRKAKKRWRDVNTRRLLPFQAVLNHLSVKAALIAGAKQDSPQPAICALDVLTCESLS
jgi:hypothetical protein